MDKFIELRKQWMKFTKKIMIVTCTFIALIFLALFIIALCN